MLAAASENAVKVSRLKKRADFLNCRNGARSHERAFVLQVCERKPSDEDGLRVGFTVTKKIGNAVARNRIKRRLREALKQTDIPSFLTCHDAVIIAREQALTEPFENLVASIEHGLQHASRGKKPSKPKHRNADQK